jgi:hypothetical protein
MTTNMFMSPNSESSSYDAYGRARVASPYVLFDASQTSTFDCQKLWDAVIWDDAASELPGGDPGGSPAVSPFIINGHITGPSGSFIGDPTYGVDINTRMVPISLENTYSASRAIIQTKEYFPIFSGRSGFVCYSGVFSPQTTPINQDVAIVIRTNVSGSVDDATYRFPQALWNQNTFLAGDGTDKNPSKVILDFTKMQNLQIDMAVPTGEIRMGFAVNGKFHLAHKFGTTNVSNVPLMQTFNLPVRYEISNQTNRATSRCGYFDWKNGVFLEVADDFVGGNAKIWMKEASVISEGGQSPGLYQNDATRTTSVALPSSDVYTAIMAIRPKILFNGIENRTRLFPTTISVATSGNNPVNIAYRRGGVISGGTWDPVSPTKSYELNVGAGSPITIAGGHDAEGLAIPPGGGSTGAAATSGQVDYRTANLLSKVDNHVTLQKPLTMIARAPQGVANLDICVLNNAELYF